MSTTLIILLFAIVTTELFILVVYQHRSSILLQRLRYQLGLEAVTLKKRIDCLKKGVQEYHDKIDQVMLDIEEFNVEQRP